MIVCHSFSAMTSILAILVPFSFAPVAEVGDVLIATLICAILVTTLNQMMLIQHPSFQFTLLVEFVAKHGSQSLCTLARSNIMSCNLVCATKQQYQHFLRIFHRAEKMRKDGRGIMVLLSHAHLYHIFAR